MNSEEIGKKLKDIFSKGAEASKNAFEKAGEAVQDFSDRSVVKIERQKLISKRNKLYEEEGEILSTLLLLDGADIKNLSAIAESNETVKASFEKIQLLQTQIVELNTQISEKDALLAE